MEKTGLVKFDAAMAAIATAKTVDEVKDIRDKAEAARTYAKQAGLSLEGQNMLAEIKLRCERKAGALLGEMEKAKPGPKPRDRSHDVSELPTLEELGISDMQSSRWQLEASVPEKDFEEHIKTTKEAAKELTSASVLRLAQKLQPKPEAPELPEGVFDVIYADPPWKYNDTCEEGAIQGKGADKHYPVMTIEELCEMPIKQITGSNAILFLWVTSPLLDECWPVITAWGFMYKASFVWDKVKHNMGHYNSVRHELLLICTRGSFLPQNKKLFDSVQSIERSSKHSEKPEEFRTIIEYMYPKSNKMELFARKKCHGWTAYGNDPKLQ